MSHSYSRLLNDGVLADHFLIDVLGYDKRKAKDASSKIVSCELSIANFNPRQTTLDTENYRDRDYRNEENRAKLRGQIVHELYNTPRLLDDNSIRLGRGGAMPITEVQSDRKAFIVIGPPASGKSLISDAISDKYGAYIIDSDYAKRKLPEFHKYPFGAHLVHEESDTIVSSGFSNNGQRIESLISKCVKNGHNVVMPKIGHNKDTIISIARSLKSLKNPYEVHLTLVNLDKRNAAIRAVERFKKTKRYVPLGLIFDGYGNDPILTYYYLKAKHQDSFASFGEVSTNGPTPCCSDNENNNPSGLFS